MAKIDRYKEKIAYAKLWLGVLVAIAVSLIGWTATSAATVGWYMIVASIVSIGAVIGAAYKVHRRIDKDINALERM